MTNTGINIYAFICTRSKAYSETTKELISYLSSAHIKVNLLINQNSIFKAYSDALERVKPKDNDVIILCHDDIEILNKVKSFLAIMYKIAMTPKIGFVGAAGTYKFTNNAVWWDQDIWRQGKHHGYVFHGTQDKPSATIYGPPGRVLVLDGLFLAARADVLRKIGLDKPSHFEGNWDFYDIHYTFTAHELGYHNFVAPLFLRHESSGELVGRDSWHKNRAAFINHTFKKYGTEVELNNEPY